MTHPKPHPTLQSEMEELLRQLLPEYERRTYNGDAAISKATQSLQKLFVDWANELIGEDERIGLQQNMPAVHRNDLRQEIREKLNRRKK